MNKLLERKTLCAFDIETTGLNPENGDRIIEVAAVRVVNGEYEDHYQSLVNPGKHIPEKIRELTGITNEMVEEAPPRNTVLNRFRDFIGDSILVAHNVSFDTKFINYYSPDPLSNPSIDTLNLSRSFLSTSKNSLDYLVDRLGLNRDDDHRALEDSRATIQLLFHIADHVNGLNDYWSGNLPVELVKEDLEVYLQHEAKNVTDKHTALMEHYSTTSEILNCDEEDIRQKTDLDENQLSKFINDLEHWYQRDISWDELRPSPGLLSSFHPSYWRWTNWLLVIGSIGFMAGALTSSYRRNFLGFLTLSISLLFGSACITYFRSDENARIKQSIGLFLSLLVGVGGFYLLTY